MKKVYYPCLLAVLSIAAISLGDYADLTTLGASATINGAIYQQLTIPESAGTGSIQSFLRIQGPSAETTPIEKGYNTDGTVEYDTMDDSFTHSIMLQEIKLVNLGGTWYREFLLDINEPAGDKSVISLDVLEIYVNSSNTLTGYVTPGLSTLVYEMAGDMTYDYVLLDNEVSSSGSGRVDMLLLIPDSLFDPYLDTDYVYMYNQFGNYAASGNGFEEWALDDPANPPIPEPATLLLICGGGLLLKLKRS